MAESIQYEVTEADRVAAIRLRLRPAILWTIAWKVALAHFFFASMLLIRQRHT